MYLTSADMWDLRQRCYPVCMWCIYHTLYSKDAVEESFAEGKVVFFAGGTGHPYFSTDTATVLRAVEIGADAILLAKAVDGIYDSDPKVNPDAKKYDEISIDEVVAKKLAAMDLTASIMCMEQKMPMLVFGLDEKDSIVNTVHGKFSGTKGDRVIKGNNKK